MAFERISISTKASVGTGIKVSLMKIRQAQAKMRFVFAPSVVSRLGLCGGDKMEVMLGTKEHHGYLRIRKNNSVGDAVLKVKKGPHNSSQVLIDLGHLSSFVDRKEPSRWCQFAIVDGWVEIKLPRWSDETRPEDAPPVHQQVQSPVRPPAQPSKSVTAAAMGDPPAGRREMLARMGSMKA